MYLISELRDFVRAFAFQQQNKKFQLIEKTCQEVHNINSKLVRVYLCGLIKHIKNWFVLQNYRIKSRTITTHCSFRMTQSFKLRSMDCLWTIFKMVLRSNVIQYYCVLQVTLSEHVPCKTQ